MGEQRRGAVGILPPVRSLLVRVTETVVPARLGRSFRWLLSATVINNVGDGIAISAGPLLSRGGSGSRRPSGGFAGSALLVAILWRQFDHIVHAGEVSDR
jgi:hypothetical protein